MVVANTISLSYNIDGEELCDPGKETILWVTFKGGGELDSCQAFSRVMTWYGSAQNRSWCSWVIAALDSKKGQRSVKEQWTRLWVKPQGH
jgi:hypothetical protein